MAASASYREKTRIQSVSRACTLLFAVARAPGGVSAAEAAAEAGLAVPTTHHLLNTLVDEGLLARDSGRRFVLGRRVAVLADAFLRDGGVPEYLTAPLHALAAATGETAYLTAWRGAEIHALASVEGAQAVRVAGVERGPYRAAHARATGKLLLAYARPELRRAVLGDGPLEPVTDRTIVDRAALDAELRAIRARGWSEDHEEFAPGVACVAAAALVDGVPVAAYTVSAPAERFARRRDALRDAVLQAARDAAGLHHDRPEDA